MPILNLPMNFFSKFKHAPICAHIVTLATVQSIKVKVKVQFTAEQATKTQRGSRGITLLFL